MGRCHACTCVAYSFVHNGLARPVSGDGRVEFFRHPSRTPLRISGAAAARHPAIAGAEQHRTDALRARKMRAR